MHHRVSDFDYLCPQICLYCVMVVDVMVKMEEVFKVCSSSTRLFYVQKVDQINVLKFLFHHSLDHTRHLLPLFYCCIFILFISG